MGYCSYGNLAVKLGTPSPENTTVALAEFKLAALALNLRRMCALRTV
jgi:hypothetical protein